MKLNCFSQFNPFIQSRLVWENAEKPAPAVGERPVEEAKPTPSPTDKSNQKAVEEGGRRAKAAGRDEAPEEKGGRAEAILAQLWTPPEGGSTESTAVVKKPPEQQHLENAYERNRERIWAIIGDILKNPELIAEREKIIDEKIPAADRNLVKHMFRLEYITDAETDDFVKRYSKDGKLDSFDLAKKMASGILPPRDFWISLKFITEKEVDQLKQNKLLTPEQAAGLSRILALIPRETPGEETVKKLIEGYKEPYEKLLSAMQGAKDEQTLAAAEEEFLKAIKPEDKKTAEWLVRGAVSKEEMDAVKAKFDSKTFDFPFPQNEQEVNTRVYERKLSYREGKVVKAMLKNLAHAAETDGTTLEKAAETVGFMTLLEKLIEKFTALADRISAELEKIFKPKEKPAEAKAEAKFDSSPLKEKFTIKEPFNSQNPNGVLLETEPRKEVTSVGKGKIEEVSTDYVTIKSPTGNLTFTYRGFTPQQGLQKGKDVGPGDVLGTTGGQLRFEMKNEKGAQMNPEPFFKPEFKQTEKPAAAPVPPSTTTAQTAPKPGEEGKRETPRFKPKISPIRSDTQLKLVGMVSEENPKGSTFEVAAGTSVQTIRDGGRVVNSKDDLVEVVYGDYTVTYRGLAPNTLTQHQSRLLSAGTELGKVGVDNRLIVEIKRNDGTSLDPAAELLAFIEKPQPAAPEATKNPDAPSHEITAAEMERAAKEEV